MHVDEDHGARALEDSMMDVVKRSGWEAGWIGGESLSVIDGSISGLDSVQHMAHAGVALFRHDIQIDKAPARAWLRISADSRYIAWINGVEVARGPARSQPTSQVADFVDVTNALRPGKNAIAVSVTYFGAANAFWMPASVSGGLGAGPAVIAEILGDGQQPEIIAATNDRWWTRRSDAYTRLARTDVEGVPAEVVDGRLYDPVWIQAKPTQESGWQRAAQIPAGHLASAGRSVPPVDPYGSVPVVEMSPLVEHTARPTRRRILAPTTTLTSTAGSHPSAVVAALSPTTSSDPGENVAKIIEFDFGRIVAGVVEADFDAPAGACFDIDLRETPVGEGPYVPHGLRYVARGTDDRFASSDGHGLRYLAVVVPPGGQVRSVSVREKSYPRVGDAFVSTGDDDLDAIWLAGVRSVQVNSTDAYTDCPTREQRSWVGDGVVHMTVDLFTNGDRGLARRFISLSASPQPGGILPMAVAGDIEAAGSTTIPSYSLLWAWGVYEYAQHEGVDATARAALPVMRRILDWFVPYVDEQGTLDSVPGWAFVDWAAIYLDGHSSILTGLWARALRAFALLSREVGNLGDAAWADERYAAARAGFDVFWNDERGLYQDRASDGTRRSRVTSQLASAVAIVSGMAPRERWACIGERMTDLGTLITRSWLGHPDHGFDPAVFEEWTRHPPEPDWDVDREVVRAEPFGSLLVHEALALAGCTDELLTSIRSWSSFLVDGYDTFREGWGWGSYAHAWSAAPSRDLIAYVLGAQPLGLSGTVWALQPTDAATGCEARVITSRGAMTIHVHEDTIEVTSPVELRVGWGADVTRLSPGTHRIPRPPRLTAPAHRTQRKVNR